MNIVLTINDNYAIPATVMLTSLFENNRTEPHHLYLLYTEGNLSRESLARIGQITARYRQAFSPCALDGSLFDGLMVDHHFSVEAYYRFMVQSILPEEADRAIYLEADQIIKGDLSAFYHHDLGGRCVSVCQSINDDPGTLLKKLHLPPENVYFNSGMILYDLQSLRAQVPQCAYFDYLHAHADRVTWMDQDVLNVIYASCKEVAERRKYNYQVFSGAALSAEELEAVERETCIVHYIGGVKPWHAAFRGRIGRYYDQYARLALPADEWNRQRTARIRHRIRDVGRMGKRAAAKVLRLLHLKKG